MIQRHSFNARWKTGTKNDPLNIDLARPNKEPSAYSEDQTFDILTIYRHKTNYTKLTSDTRKIKLAANCIFISTSTWYVHGPDDWKRVCWSSWKCTLDGPLEIWKLPSRIAFENNFHMHRLLGKNVTSQGWRHDNLHVSKLNKTAPVFIPRNKMRK